MRRPTRPTIALAGGALLGALTGICALVCTAHAEKPRGDFASSGSVATKQTGTPAGVGFVPSSTKIPAAGGASSSIAPSLTGTAPRALAALPTVPPRTKTAPNTSGIATRPAPFGADAGKAGSLGGAPIEVALAAQPEPRPLKDQHLQDPLQRGISPFKKGVDMSAKITLVGPAAGGSAGKLGPAHPVARAK